MIHTEHILNMNLIQIVVKEFKDTLERPQRLGKLFDYSSLKKWLRFQEIRVIARNDWKNTGNISQRNVPSYDQYIKLQKSKLEYLDLSSHEKKFRTSLRQRLSELHSQDYIKPSNRTALCLGARLGAEVAAFRDLGYFAVGVDLNPGNNNPYVMYGDFHKLEFSDNSVDVIYSNSLDHCYELKLILSEIKRLLKNDGYLIIEADPGSNEGISPDLWATMSYETVDSLKTEIETSGLILVQALPFEYPRNGTQLVFTR
ncbi:MAG: class I SAM-dependent methyltransferase [Sphaerospermopsis kisseleviana]